MGKRTIIGSVSGAGCVLAGVLVMGEIGGAGDPINLYTEGGTAALTGAECPEGSHFEFNPISLSPTGVEGENTLLKGTEQGADKSITLIAGTAMLNGVQVESTRVLGTAVLNAAHGCIIAVNDFQAPRESIFDKVERYVPTQFSS